MAISLMSSQSLLCQKQTLVCTSFHISTPNHLRQTRYSQTVHNTRNDRRMNSIRIQCTSFRPSYSRRCRYAVISANRGSQEAFNNESYTGPTVEEEAALKAKADEIGKDLRGTSIFLVGMMGSGKSTMGKVLAEALGYCFFDSDKVIEQTAGGAPVAQIFVENGEESFRDIETQVIAHLSGMVRLVVATGGGAVLRAANWGRMRDGVTVWLDVPINELANRLNAGGIESRPLLSNGPTSSEDPYTECLGRLTETLDARAKLYAQADAIVSLQAIAAEDDGCQIGSISPHRIALQVLKEIGLLTEARKLKDAALRMSY